MNNLVKNIEEIYIGKNVIRMDIETRNAIISMTEKLNAEMNRKKYDGNIFASMFYWNRNPNRLLWEPTPTMWLFPEIYKQKQKWQKKNITPRNGILYEQN